MPALETRFAVLLFTDIVGSTELKARHGVPAYSEALRTHNGHFERLAHECRNIASCKTWATATSPKPAALRRRCVSRCCSRTPCARDRGREVRLTTRVGIHAGEVGTIDSEGGSGIVAPAADLAARVMSLALGGQILLTRMPVR